MLHHMFNKVSMQLSGIMRLIGWVTQGVRAHYVTIRLLSSAMEIMFLLVVSHQLDNPKFFWQ